jgi:tetratricopeptide (TPR) repeat protein/regulation of enolase protein 1 (concanavalin A-like superfamily)
MQARGDLVQDMDGFWIPAPTLDWNYLPGQVEAVIASRVDRLEQCERSILEVACVQGIDFTAEVAGRVERLPPNTIFEILDQECRDRHRLVKDLGDKLIHGRTFSQYKFNHPSFNTYLYQSLSSGKRRFLHGEVATALEALYGEHTDRIVVELGYHYDAAGVLKKAVPYLLAAGKKAQASHANEEAIAYYNRVLDLLKFQPLTLSEKNWKLQAFIALGVIFMNSGQIAEAETHLTTAISLGKEIKLPLNELIIIYHWLGEVYIWQNRPYDRIQIGREGLTLLGDKTESKETALMNQAIAMGYWLAGDRDNFKRYTLRTEKLLRELPHSTELSLFYIHIAIMYTEEKEFVKAMKWLSDLENRAIEYDETRFLGEAYVYMGDLLFEKGDFKESLEKFRKAQEIFDKIWDRGQEPGGSLNIMGWICFSMGDFQNAAKLLEKSVEIAKDVGVNRWIAKNLRLLAHIFIAQGNLEDAEKSLWTALDLLGESKDHLDLLWTKYYLGWVSIKKNNFQDSKKQFQEILIEANTGSLNGYQIPDLHFYNKLLIGPLLNGLEKAYEFQNDPSKERFGDFQSFCRNLKKSNKALQESPFVQWYLMPVNLPTLTHRIRLEDDLFQPFELGWTWHDSMGDCSFSHDNGFLIHAANGRDLWYLNLSAPRIIRPAEGDLTIQTFCSSGLGDRPANGGLLLWVDECNYLTLDRGRRSANEISFQGCVDNQDFIIGRGQLQIDDHDEIYLRIDRSGEHVNAYCSSDGQDWFTVGYCRFPNQDQVQVGLFANGKIPREIYCGSFPNGTAIRFQKFWLWGEESTNIDQNAQR